MANLYCQRPLLCPNQKDIWMGYRKKIYAETLGHLIFIVYFYTITMEKMNLN